MLVVPNFSDYWDDFKNYLRFEKRYSLHTINAYFGDLAQFNAYLISTYGNPSIHEINHFILRSWLSTLKENGLNNSSINRKNSSVSNYFKYLMRHHIVSNNPGKLLHNLKQAERLPQFIKEHEAQALVETPLFDEGFEGQTQQLIIVLLYSLGLRRSELVQLKEAAIEWNLNQIRVLGKGQKERLLPIDIKLKNTLLAYISIKKEQQLLNDQLLVLPNGKNIYDKYVYRVVKRYLSMVCSLKKKSPHILRHSFASHLLNNGANIQAIKELLGHSSLAATQIYTHLNIDNLKKIHKLNHPRS